MKPEKAQWMLQNDFFFLKAMLIGDSFYLMDILSSKNSSLNGYLAKHVEPTDLTEWNLT